MSGVVSVVDSHFLVKETNGKPHASAHPTEPTAAGTQAAEPAADADNSTKQVESAYYTPTEPVETAAKPVDNLNRLFDEQSDRT